MKDFKHLKQRIEATCEIYKKRKSACIDMLEYLDQHLNEDFAEIISSAGIDMEDIKNTKDIERILFGDISDDGDEEEKDEETHVKNGKKLKIMECDVEYGSEEEEGKNKEDNY